MKCLQPVATRNRYIEKVSEMISCKSLFCCALVEMFCGRFLHLFLCFVSSNLYSKKGVFSSNFAVILLSSHRTHIRKTNYGMHIYIHYVNVCVHYVYIYMLYIFIYIYKCELYIHRLSVDIQIYFYMFSMCMTLNIQQFSLATQMALKHRLPTWSDKKVKKQWSFYE